MTRMRLLTLISATMLLTATFAASAPARADGRHGGWQAQPVVTYSFSYGYGPNYYGYYYSTYSTAGRYHRPGQDSRAYPRTYYRSRWSHYRYGDGFHDRRWEHARHFRGERFADRHDWDHRFDRHHGH